jgi:hypothetical protein
MRSSAIKRATILQTLALTGLALALPLASQASKGTPKAGPPIVATGGVGRVTGSSVALHGTIDPHGTATTYYFQYGPTVAYGSQTTTASLPAGFARVKVTQTVNKLLQGYHYRLVASNEHGSANGKDRAFTKAPTVQKNRFVLPTSFAPTALGGTFIFSGTLTGTGNAGRQIVLQASPYPYTAPFANVGSPITTSATGAFSFRVANLKTSTRFRVSVLSTPPLYSLVLTEHVTASVTLKARTAGHSGLARLYGTVTPAEVGARVFLQLEKPERTAKPKVEGEKPAKPEKPGKSEKSQRSEERPPSFSTKFTTVVKRATRTSSRFSIVVKIQDTGSYRAVVEVSSGPVASGHSQSILLHAPTKKAKSKTKKKG